MMASTSLPAQPPEVPLRMTTARRQPAPAASPMVAQYQALKAAHPDAPAVLPHGRLLRAVLRGRRRGGPGARHRADQARPAPRARTSRCAACRRTTPSPTCERLIRRGFKVAICEQTRGSGRGQAARRQGAGAARRRAGGDPRHAHRGRAARCARAATSCVALARSQQSLALAWLDLSTGEFLTAPVDRRHLPAELARIAPREMLLPETLLGRADVGRLVARRSASA